VSRVDECQLLWQLSLSQKKKQKNTHSNTFILDLILGSERHYKEYKIQILWEGSLTRWQIYNSWLTYLYGYTYLYSTH